MHVSFVLFLFCSVGVAGRSSASRLATPAPQEGMKPDGVTMETTEAKVGTELPSAQVAAEERGSAASPDEEETAASPPAGQEGSDTPAGEEAHIEPNDSLKSKPTTTAPPAAVGGGGGAKTKAPPTPNKRPGAPSRSGSQAAVKSSGPLPKNRNQTADNKSAGRGSSAPAKVANEGQGSLSTSVPKRAPVGPGNGARPGAPRGATSTISKPSSSAAAAPDRTVTKATRYAVPLTPDIP